MQQIAIFIAVGCAAAAVHFAVVLAAVETLALHPLAANAIAFGVAFVVSFGGHSRWTFPIGQEQHASARMRFFAVALTGFVINQTAYAWALHIFGKDYYQIILPPVILGVAAATFFLSKLWAFAQPQG